MKRLALTIALFSVLCCCSAAMASHGYYGRYPSYNRGAPYRSHYAPARSYYPRSNFTYGYVRRSVPSAAYYRYAAPHYPRYSSYGYHNRVYGHRRPAICY